MHFEQNCYRDSPHRNDDLLASAHCAPPENKDHHENAPEADCRRQITHHPRAYAAYSSSSNRNLRRHGGSGVSFDIEPIRRATGAIEHHRLDKGRQRITIAQKRGALVKVHRRLHPQRPLKIRLMGVGKL